jgi:aryl-alcohol dehydrogenase-like predicted oxidoreductase
MEYTRLGRTGLEVSRLCLGTMNFGPYTSEADSHAILDRSLDAGINFVDTANVYGWKRGEGVTEQIVGRWLAGDASRREQTVVATKVFGRMGTGPNESRLSKRHIQSACEGSLRRLRTDRIDLYQMHHVDRQTPWEEVWEAMEVLVRQGKVLYVGSSNFAGWHIAHANGVAVQRGFLGLVSEQSLYNLATRTIELEVLPACRGLGLAVLPWSPLGGGLLGGVLGKEKDGAKRRANDQVQKSVARHRAALEAYESLCARLGERPADVAIAWLLHQPGVTSPILGPRTIEQLADGLHATELRLSEDTLRELDRIWPGPGGEAPEAYAW